MKTTIILTCVGSQVSPSIIQTIRDHPSRELRVVGVDNREPSDSVGAHFSDAYYRVPMGSDPAYPDVLEDIVRREEARVILPGSDEEAMALSGCRERFEREGCRPVCSSTEATSLAMDKFLCMARLRDAGIPVAGFAAFQSLGELEKAAERLGFPETPFVIKPRISRGGRGFRVVEREIDLFSGFMQGDTTRISYRVLEQVLHSVPDRMKEFFVMEYLPGKRYSADILVRQGSMTGVVIRNKLFPVGSPTQVADIVFDQDIVHYSKAVLETIPFDYFVQFEIGRNGQGLPRLIEINPRLDATLPICLGLDVNFYHEMINHALGDPYSKRLEQCGSGDRNIRFFRYWQHRFVSLS